jgi:hypothetical protein
VGTCSSGHRFFRVLGGPGLRTHGGSRRGRGPHGRGPSDATRPADIDEVNRFADVVF